MAKKPVTLTAKQLAARVKQFEKARDAFFDEMLDVQTTIENEARRHDYEIMSPIIDQVMLIAQEIETAGINLTMCLEYVEIQAEDGE